MGSHDDVDLTMMTGFVTPGRRLNKLDATVGPVGTDDADGGYEVRSIWVDTTADKSYICVDSTAGAAIWQQFSGVGAGTRQRRVVMRPGISSPPEPVSNVNGDGWVYMEID